MKTPVWNDDYRHRDDDGPGRVFAGFVAVGLFGGRRGRLALRRTKRLAGCGALLFLAGVPLTYFLPQGFNVLGFILCMGGAPACFFLWCHAALAMWLTRDKQQDLDE